MNIKEIIRNYIEKIKSDKKEFNRFLFLLVGSFLFLNYIMFSYHTEKNIFNIFPSMPILEKKINIDIFLPSADNNSIFKEKRSIKFIENDKNFIKLLFRLVKRGSRFENTVSLVPAELFIRKVWVEKGICVIDFEPLIIADNVERSKGSEKKFRDALTKTITSNISKIKKVVVLEHGVPFRSLWGKF
jgi:hypothetical protein